MANLLIKIILVILTAIISYRIGFAVCMEVLARWMMSTLEQNPTISLEEFMEHGIDYKVKGLKAEDAIAMWKSIIRYGIHF